MDDLTFEILQAAVRIARNEQIRTIATLRARLTSLYPGQGDQCDVAISEWARLARNTEAVYE